MPGPKPLPREVKEQRGTLKKSREAKKPITGLAPLGKAPRGMSMSERKVWHWVKGHAPHLRDLDELLVRRLCELEVEYDQVKQLVEKHGRIQVFDSGASNLSGAESLKLKLLAQLLKLYAEIGTPSSRSKLEMPGPASDDEDAEFLFGKAKLKAME